MRPNQPERYPHPLEVQEQLEKGSKGYGWPEFGHDAEMRSLLYHVRLRDGLRTDMPSDYDRKLIMGELERQYRDARWRVPDDFMSYEHYERCVRSIDMTSSPGYPYMRRATTNGVFFQVKDGVYNEARLREVWEVVKLKIRERRSDPIRLFIKPEPHKQKKLDEQRYRLISSVSVLDQIIDAMLFGSMNDAVIENCITVPCKGGWSVYNGGWKMVPSKGVISLDKSGWDWSVQPWYFELELQLRIRLCDNLTPDWIEYARWRYQSLFWNPTFITSGGLKLRQLQPGVMKSGCYNTLVTNSIMQSILHLRLCAEMDIRPGWLWTLGDDTLQEDIPQRKQYLERASQYCHVKHCVEGAEFAGMRFLSGRIEPLYRGKHSFNLLHMDRRFARETSDSYALLYHRSFYSSVLKKMLEPLLNVKSDDQRDSIWDGW